MNFDDLSTLDLVSILIAVSSLFIALFSTFFALVVFVQNEKNYYEAFLKFLRKKERRIKRRFARKGIKDPIYAEYLMDDVRFFGENFFVNFSNDGYLKYHQFKTIKGIYKHLRKRLRITGRVFWRAVKKEKNATIIMRLQIFNKYNYINKTYFANRMKNAKMKKEDPNVYVTIKLKYDREKKTFINESLNQPSSIFEMGSDFEFKKNMYYIFSRANKFDDQENEDQVEKQYFFAACSTYKKALNVTDDILEIIEDKEEKQIKKK